MSRTTAQRIVDTLQARTSGLLPPDFDEQLVADVDAMSARYEELRLTHGFGDADRIVKTELVARLIGA